MEWVLLKIVICNVEQDARVDICLHFPAMNFITRATTRPKFFHVAKHPQTVRGAQLAVLELLKQPEGNDVSWPIKMFGGIHHLFFSSNL